MPLLPQPIALDIAALSGTQRPKDNAPNCRRHAPGCASAGLLNGNSASRGV
ncbi:hypothetical protein ABIE78_002630 [Sinorhizobium fredii]